MVYFFINILTNKNLKDIYNEIKYINILRNRIFHYEPIIFKFDLEYLYNIIMSLINIMTNKNVFNKIKNLNNFKILYIEYSKFYKK